MRWPGKKPAAGQAAEPAAAAPQTPVVAEDGKERLTANEWAKRHGLNEVQAERAAMRAGRWHDTFAEEEFFELLRRGDV